MNSEQDDMKKLGVSCREQTWEIHYAYALLMKELCDKHDHKVEYYIKKVSPYNACAYQRSANLCRNHLLAKGLITGTDQPVMKTVLQTAAQYATAPEYKLKVSSGEYSWNYKPHESPESAYTDLARLGKRELLYVYLNQKLYDIHVHSVTRKSNYSEDIRTETSLNTYPKAMIKELIDTLCHEKINHFLNERIQLKAKIFYGLEMQKTENDKDYIEITKYKKNTPITVEEFERRMCLAQDAVSFYQRTYKDLKSKRDRLSSGKTVLVDHEAYKKVIAYFKLNAPLYINEVEDKELLHFAKLIMMGASNKKIAYEWLNP